jgi:uncharacterized protein (UPF0276 family)
MLTLLTDVHSTAVPEPVWQLLDWLVPRAPNLAGVSFEVDPGAAGRGRTATAAAVAALERSTTTWPPSP